MYFFQSGAERTFSTFDIVHLIVLVISAIVIGFVFLKRNKLKELNNKDLISYILAGILLFLDFSFYFWKYINGNQPHFPIPMHICSWATYLVALSLIFKKDFLFQVSIYYGITGGILSLLVPEFGGYSYDHMRFYQFFALHLLILVLPLYQYFTYGLKLKYKYMYYTIVLMWIQAFFAIFINKFLAQYFDGEVQNMMFVNEPPVALPGLLGQSPIYLLVFSILFLLLWNGLYKLLTMEIMTKK